MPVHRQPQASRSGQSLIETCLAIALICLIFMGLLQVSQLLAAREILHHAAARGARAKTVGFNWWMVRKATQVALIPNAGRMTNPHFENSDQVLIDRLTSEAPGSVWDWVVQETPRSDQYEIESARIPEYMASDNQPRGRAILDYENWDHINVDHGPTIVGEDGSVLSASTAHITVHHRYPLWTTMHRTFYADDHVDLEGEAFIENHYPLYLDDQLW